MVEILHPARTPQGTLVTPIAPGNVSPMDPNSRPHSVGPFTIVVYFDDTFGPREAPQDLDVRPHPHVGIATLTYLFDGAITHRDGLGNSVEIQAGDIAWMVTGRGVVHSERFPTVREAGGRLRGLQVWVALSEREEDAAPSFDLVPAAKVRVFEGEGASVRHVLAAEAPPHPSKDAFGALWLHDVKLALGATYSAPVGKDAALFVLEGTLEVDGQTLSAGKTACLRHDDLRRFVTIEPAHAICFGGDPIGPRYLWWNYLHSRKERIDEAKAAWREKRYPLPADDRDDIIPLPADHERPLRLINPPAG